MHICRHTYWGLQVWECRKTGSFSSLQACCSHFGQTVLVSEISWHQCRDADFGSWLWCTFLKETFSMYYHFSPLMCAWVPSNSNGPPPNTCGVFAWLFFDLISARSCLPWQVPLLWAASSTCWARPPEKEQPHMASKGVAIFAGATWHVLKWQFGLRGAANLQGLSSCKVQEICLPIKRGKPQAWNWAKGAQNTTTSTHACIHTYVHTYWNMVM